jgi:DNA repair photolyase
MKNLLLSIIIIVTLSIPNVTEAKTAADCFKILSWCENRCESFFGWFAPMYAGCVVGCSIGYINCMYDIS